VTLQAVPPSSDRGADRTIDLDADPAVRVVPSGRLWLVTVDGVGRVGRFDTKVAALAAARARARRGSHRIIVSKPDGSVQEYRAGRRTVSAQDQPTND
jgi:hypothetical protein